MQFDLFSSGSNALTSESNNLSLAGQIIICTLLSLLALVFLGGCYHMCTRHWRDKEDIESPSRFENWSTSARRRTMQLPLPLRIAIARKAKPEATKPTVPQADNEVPEVDTEKIQPQKVDVEVIEEEVEPDTEEGSCHILLTLLQSIQRSTADHASVSAIPASSSRSSSNSSVSSSNSSSYSSLETPRLPGTETDAVPTIVFQPSESDPNIPPSTTSDFPVSASSLEVQMLLATHAHLQVGPDVKPESLLRVPIMSWTGRILEVGEPELPSSCSLIEEYGEVNDCDDWDDSDESLSLIYDLTRPLTPTPSAPRDLDEAVATSLMDSLSLDLDSILLAAANRFGNSPGYGCDGKERDEDKPESFDEDEIYVGIMPAVNKASDRVRTSVVVLAVNSP